MKNILLLTLVLGLVSCSSNKVGQLNTTIETKGTFENGVIGLQDGVAVIQKKNLLVNEMRQIQWQNYDLESDLLHEQALIKWCYNDLADPRLKGDGNVAKMPKNALKPSGKIKEEIGLENEDLIILQTEDLKERLVLERKYTKSLTELLSLAKDTRENCERNMGYARIKAGLPAKRYQGRVNIDQDGNITKVVAPHEDSLDKAIEIKNETPVVSKEDASNQ